MPERTDFSPTEQSVFNGNRREKILLKRISNLALRLPEEFDEKGKLGRLRVYGETSGEHAVIKIEEDLPREDDGARQLTDINLMRSITDSEVLLALNADRYIVDDVGELYGVTSPHQTFSLGAEDNALSLFNVMRGVSLAVRTVEDTKMPEYLSRPEASLPQLF